MGLGSPTFFLGGRGPPTFKFRICLNKLSNIIRIGSIAKVIFFVRLRTSSYIYVLKSV